MKNNQVLKKLSIGLNLHHEHLLNIFRISEPTMNLSQVKAYMVAPKHKNFLSLSDDKLLSFMDNLISYSRGEKDQKDKLPDVYRHLIISLAAAGKSNALEELIETASEALAICMEDMDD